MTADGIFGDGATDGIFGDYTVGGTSGECGTFRTLAPACKGYPPWCSEMTDADEVRFPKLRQKIKSGACDVVNLSWRER